MASSRINSTITNLDQELQSFALDAWRQFSNGKALQPGINGWRGVANAFSKFLSKHENPTFRIMACLIETDQNRNHTMRRWVDQSLSESERTAVRERCNIISSGQRNSAPEKIETVQPMPQPVEEKLVEMAADPSVPDVSDQLFEVGEILCRLIDDSTRKLDTGLARLDRLESTVDSIIKPMTDPE